ncbi:MAG: saccharopine dehydrogenase NADP-binding domain-containing protein, partial [Chromatiales bacterium]|nr:saccharopine dehydrogenase NADP-binding domain-containing protein [Chromatiales bacterium]
MKVLVIGCGLQGRAVVHDLAASDAVEQLTCADVDLGVAQAACEHAGGSKLRPVALEARDDAALSRLIDGGFDV